VRPLDDWLPQWDAGELHETRVTATPERALAAMLELPIAADRLTNALFHLRGLRADGRTADVVAAGAALLEHTPTVWVIGLAGRPWQRRGGRVRFAAAEEWRAYADPGSVRMALALWAEPAEGGARLLTETRISALDDRARRLFRRYWLVVGPFSGLIRRRWLAAAKRALR
jgi:hypothetical protein